MTLPASLLQSFKGKLKGASGASNTVGGGIIQGLRSGTLGKGSTAGKWKPAFAGGVPEDQRVQQHESSPANSAVRSASTDPLGSPQQGQGIRSASAGVDSVKSPMSNRPLPDTPGGKQRPAPLVIDNEPSQTPEYANTPSSMMVAAASSSSSSGGGPSSDGAGAHVDQLYMNTGSAAAAVHAAAAAARGNAPAGPAYMNQQEAASAAAAGGGPQYMNAAEAEQAARQGYIEVGEADKRGSDDADEEDVAPSLPHLAPGETLLVTAIYKYEAAAEDELSLIEGSQILVTEVAEDGWVYGSSCLTGAVGWFHGSYAQPDKDARFVVGTRNFAPEPGSRQAEKALSFVVNERLRVLAETSQTWWIAQRQTDGKEVGFIPAKYVTEAPQPRPRTMRSLKVPGTTAAEPSASSSADTVPEVWLADFEFKRKVSRRSSSLLSATNNRGSKGSIGSVGSVGSGSVFGDSAGSAIAGKTDGTTDC